MGLCMPSFPQTQQHLVVRSLQENTKVFLLYWKNLPSLGVLAHSENGLQFWAFRVVYFAPGT